jgi:hypothetical protein
MNKMFNITVTQTVNVTEEDIDDIMCSALEGGITYWANAARVVGNYLGEYASEQISRGGSLIISDAEEDAEYLLTRDNLLKGIKLAIQGNYFMDYEWVVGSKLDCCQVDAEVADVIVQLALFDEVVYG